MSTDENLDPLQLARQLLAILPRRGLTARDATTVELALAVHLTARAAQVLALHLCEPARDDYPVTIQALMAAPGPALDVEVDARVEPQELLGLVDLLDLLSDTELSCIAPRLHRGWRDRRQSCREARRISTGRAGFALSGGEREDLMLGLAASNRCFLVPPPLTLERQRVRRALPPMLNLAARLARAAGARDLDELIGGILEPITTPSKEEAP